MVENLLKVLTDDEKQLLNKIVKKYEDMSDVEDQLAEYMMF